MKKIFCIFFLGFLLISFASQAQTADSTATLKVKVSGIGCSGDMAIIKKKLINQEGIDEVTFTDKTNDASTFTIVFHPLIIDEKKIRKIIESAPCCDNPNEFPYKAKTLLPTTIKPRK